MKRMEYQEARDIQVVQSSLLVAVVRRSTNDGNSQIMMFAMPTRKRGAEALPICRAGARMKVFLGTLGTLVRHPRDMKCPM